MSLGQAEQVRAEAIGALQAVGEVVEELDLVKEPRVDAGDLVDLGHREPTTHGLLDGEESAIGGAFGDGEQLTRRPDSGGPHASGRRNPCARWNARPSGGLR